MRLSNSDDDSKMVESKIKWSQNPTLPKKSKLPRKRKPKLEKVDKMLINNTSSKSKEEIIQPSVTPIIKKSKKPRAKRIKIKEPSIENNDDMILNDIPIIPSNEEYNLSDLVKKKEISEDKPSRPFWE